MSFILFNRECPICFSENSQVYKHSHGNLEKNLSGLDLQCTSSSHCNHFQIVECQECTLKYCSPMISESDLFKIYEEIKDLNYDYLTYGRIKTALNALRIIPCNENSTLLDIGCNTGIFLQEARRLGFLVAGLEPNILARERCRSRSILTYESMQSITEKYNVITLWDVIEHLYSPIDLCKSIYERLHGGGQFHLSTMRHDSLAVKILKSAWPWYMPMHIQYFTTETMTLLLQKAGFSKITFHPYIHHPTFTYIFAKVFMGKRESPLKNFLMKFSKPTFPFYIGDMMHVVAHKN